MSDLERVRHLEQHAGQTNYIRNIKSTIPRERRVIHRFLFITRSVVARHREARPTLSVKHETAVL